MNKYKSFAIWNNKIQKANKKEVFDKIKVIVKFHINHGNNFGLTVDEISESISKSLYPSVIKNSHLITKAMNCDSFKPRKTIHD